MMLPLTIESLHHGTLELSVYTERVMEEPFDGVMLEAMYTERGGRQLFMNVFVERPTWPELRHLAHGRMEAAFREGNADAA